MKIRVGFVSNSSSSSFVVARCDIPDEEEFDDLVDQHNNVFGCDGTIYKGKRYYVGRISQNDITIREYLERRNIYYEVVS